MKSKSQLQTNKKSKGDLNMTIHEIKKSIIDRILDNKEIIDVFDLESYGVGVGDTPKLRNNIVFNYLTLFYGSDFISVDVSEKESITEGDKCIFSVIINFGLSNIQKNYEGDKNKLDVLSELIKEIITDLYPDRISYQDVVNIKEVYINDNFPSNVLSTIQSTTRCITFDVHI